MISLFWQYFKNTLNWLPLSSRYLQIIVKGLAHQFDSTRTDIIWLRNQFNVETSDDELLDNYALSRGINRLPLDSDTQYKLRVINAYRWQKLAAKQEGLPIILAEYGYPGARIEYFEDKEHWAEFKVVFGDGEYGQDYGILPIINEFKPARSKLGKVITPAYSRGIYSIIGYTQIQDSILSLAKSPTLHLTVVGYTKIYDYILSIKGD